MYGARLDLDVSVQRACANVYGGTGGRSPFLTSNFKSTGWPAPRLFNESMLSNLRPNHNLGNYFKTYATPLLLPRGLADKELLVSEVGCYDPRSDKSSNKDYNSHLDFRPLNSINCFQRVPWSCASIFRYALVRSRLTRDHGRAHISTGPDHTYRPHKCQLDSAHTPVRDMLIVNIDRRKTRRYPV